MNIDISDDLIGCERRRILEVYPILYALNKFEGDKGLVSAFLGMSRRGLFNKIVNNDELKCFHIQQTYSREFCCEDKEVRKDPLIKIYNWHLNKVHNSFWFYQLSESEKNEVINRIKSLYLAE